MVPKDHIGIILPEDRISMVPKDLIGIIPPEDPIGTVPKIWPNRRPHEFSQILAKLFWNGMQIDPWVFKSGSGKEIIFCNQV